MNPLQNDILYLLMHASLLTYTQLKPSNMPSNRFAYHLDQLVKNGLITKTDEGYKLTSAGMSLADRVSHETMAVRLQPHIVTTLSVTNSHGKTVLFRHAFHPYLGVVGYPQGRIHYGETVATAAARELAEKTCLANISLTHRGIVYVTGREGDTDMSRILSHVFAGTVEGLPKLACADKSKGDSFWGDPAMYMHGPHMPGFAEIAELLEKSNNSLFFAEITTAMPYARSQQDD